MRYFGEPYDAPVYEGIERAPTPVGWRCFKCKVEFVAEDRGFLIPHLGSLETDAHGGAAVIGEEPWHTLCFHRDVLGPMADDIELTELDSS